jgi:hypothetical protein
MARRRRRNGAVERFSHEHPWMTFFIVTGAISGIVTLVRGRPTLAELGVSPSTPPPGTPAYAWGPSLGPAPAAPPATVTPSLAPAVSAAAVSAPATAPAIGNVLALYMR